MTAVYLVEYIWYDCYELLGCYASEEVAIAHAQDPITVKKYGTVSVIEVGVRTRKQFKPIHERQIELPVVGEKHGATTQS